MKFLLLLVFFAVVWLLFKKRDDDAETGISRRPHPEPENMVVCAHCGVHLPESDGVPAAGGRYYCSEAHRQAAEGAARE